MDANLQLRPAGALPPGRLPDCGVLKGGGFQGIGVPQALRSTDCGSWGNTMGVFGSLELLSVSQASQLSLPPRTELAISALSKSVP